jgi:hypothetical protein
VTGYRVVGHEEPETLLIDVQAIVNLFLRLAKAGNDVIIRSHIMREHHLEKRIDAIRARGEDQLEQFGVLLAASRQKAAYDNSAEARFEDLNRLIERADSFLTGQNNRPKSVLAHAGEPF